MTGAAIQALRAAGRPDTEAERKGLEYLREMQNPDGGFPEFPGEAGVERRLDRLGGAGDLGGRAGSRNLASGAERSRSPTWPRCSSPTATSAGKRARTMNGIWMTAYVAPAFAGQAWPIPSAPCGSKQPSLPRSRARARGVSRAAA